jgi:hypothetical protein
MDRALRLEDEPTGDPGHFEMAGSHGAMTGTAWTLPDAGQAIPDLRLAQDLRGAAQLVLAGVAVRVVHCGLGGDDVTAALAEVADLTEVVPIFTEHDAAHWYSVTVGPLRPR